MAKYKVYVKAMTYGSVIVEAETAEDAEIDASNMSHRSIDWDDTGYGGEVDLSADEEDTVQVCDDCEGNPDDGLTDGKCGACRA